MLKSDFLYELENRLSGLPREDMKERVAFYGEMIDDRIEEGMTEDDAVAAIGTIDEIAEQILCETPLAKIAKEKIKQRRRMSAFEIVLIVLGFPIWFSILCAAFAVVFSIYISLWSVIISLWAVFASAIGSALGAGVAGGVLAVLGRTLAGVALIGAGIFLAGLSVFLFFGCKAATKGILWLTKKMALGIKKSFLKGERVNG